MYKFALKNGALGGKLLGAGGGGFLLLYVKKNDQKIFFKKLKKVLHIPFKFSDLGSQIILNSKNF